MRPLQLYREYDRDEVIAILHHGGEVEEFSRGELICHDGAGSLLAEVGQPPSRSYFLTGQVFRWFSAESDLQFCNSTMADFRSRWRPGGRALHLFARPAAQRHFTYLGLLRVARSDGPSSDSGSHEFPTHVIVEFDVEPGLPHEQWARFDWTVGPVLINGLPLPRLLKEAITTGRWKHSPPDEMARLTEGLRDLDEEGYGAGYRIGQSAKLGRDIDDPDILDLDRAICLGYTKPEEVFCLDYRNDASRPRVVHLVGEDHLSWRTVAHDLETFVDRMDMCLP
jgi:hypothetical protein